MSRTPHGSGGPTHRPISKIFLVLTLAIAGWWTWFAWKYHPAREIYRIKTKSAQAKNPSKDLAKAFDIQSGRLLLAVQSTVADVSGGLVVLLLFYIGVGTYVRRFETWVEARGSGDAAALRGIGLDDQALAANANRKKGGLK